jgi:hypothetical protein
MQETLVGIMILAAVGYGCWRVFEAFRRAEDPCYSCAGCPLKTQKQAEKKKKADCWHKK